MGDIKNIAMVLPSLGMGGAERVACELANEMIKRNINVHFFLLDYNDVYYTLDKRIKVDFVDFDRNKNKISKNFYRIKKLRSMLKANSIDIVISFLTSANFLALLATMNMKIKVFVSERSNPNVDSKKIKIIRNILYKMADGCVFQTNDALNIFKGKIKKRAIVIENPVKSDLPEWQTGKHENTIVTASRLEKSKNIPMLLDAFKIARSECKDLKLLIYGDGPEKSNIQDIVNQEKLDNCVFLKGKDVNWHSKAIKCKAFVLSSDYEGMSNSLIEALSMGMPVVSTDHPIGGAAALINNNKSGFLVPVKNHKSMAEKIVEIINNEKLQIAFSKEAVKVKDRLSVKNVTDKWLEYISK